MRNDTTGPRAEATSRAAHHSIRSVADMERDFLERDRTLTERTGDVLGGAAGSMGFVALQIVFIAGWILVNLGLVPAISPFDRFPFSLLELVLSVEALFLVTFILMRENRMRRQAAQRDQLHLQVDLLADRKVSEILRVLLQMSEQLGLQVARDQDEHLSRETHLETLQKELEENLPQR